MFCSTFRAKSSRSMFVHFCRLSLPSPGQFSPDVSPFQSSLVSFGQFSQVESVSRSYKTKTHRFLTDRNEGPPQERRRCCAEKRLSKRVFLESPFLLCPLKVFSCLKIPESLIRGQRRREETDSQKNTLLDNHFSAHVFSAPLARSEERWGKNNTQKIGFFLLGCGHGQCRGP